MEYVGIGARDGMFSGVRGQCGVCAREAGGLEWYPKSLIASVTLGHLS